MSMHQMKRAELSGWKHYKKVILKSHKRESLVEFFWDSVEERYDRKRTQCQASIYWFSYQPQRLCHVHPHFAFSLLHRGGLGVRFPFLLCTELAIVPSQRVGGSQATCSPPSVLTFTRAKSRSSRGCVRFCSYCTLDVYKKLCLTLTKQVICQLLCQVPVKHFLGYPLDNSKEMDHTILHVFR